MNLPRPLAEPPRVLRFVIEGDVVPAQMGVLIPGVGYANRDPRGARARSYKDKVRMLTSFAVRKARWTSTPTEGFSVTLRAFVGTLRTIDLDNIFKNVLDGLKCVAFPDDRQVHELHGYKALDRDHPRLEVEIARLEP